MAWITPKTNWQGTDYFTSVDWLRIVGNVEFLADYYTLQGITFIPYTAVTDGETMLTADDRNYVVETLEEMYRVSFLSWNREYVTPRVAYGSPWGSRELNAIESLCDNLYNYIHGYPGFGKKVEYYAGGEIYCDDALSVGLL